MVANELHLEEQQEFASREEKGTPGEKSRGKAWTREVRARGRCPPLTHSTSAALCWDPWRSPSLTGMLGWGPGGRPPTGGRGPGSFSEPVLGPEREVGGCPAGRVGHGVPGRGPGPR